MDQQRRLNTTCPECGGPRGDSRRLPVVLLRLNEVKALIREAAVALDGISNDAEHDALFRIHERLLGYAADQKRRLLS